MRWNWKVASVLRLLLVLKVALNVSKATGPIVEPPTVRTFLHSNGVAEIQKVINPILVNTLENTLIPNTTFSFAGINVHISDIKVLAVSLGQQEVINVPPYNMAVVSTNMTGKATMNWRYTDGPAIDISGKATDTITDMSMGIVIGVNSVNRILDIDIVQCSVQIGKLDIELPGSSDFYQKLVDLLGGPVTDLFQSQIAANVEKFANQLIAQYFLKPLVFNLNISVGSAKAHIYAGLVSFGNFHGLYGHKYGNNHFSGSGSSYQVTTLDLDVGAYDSLNVTGFFSPPFSGNYSFQMHYKQRSQIQFNGKTTGGLEMHNPGMCWPEYHTDYTDMMYLVAGEYYPVELLYQSGCGGGSVGLNVCVGSTGNCTNVNPFYLDATPTSLGFPVLVHSDFVSVSFLVQGYHGPEKKVYNISSDPLPDSLPSNFNPSSDMLAFYIDGFVFSSTLQAFTDAGLFNVHADNSDIPPSLRSFFQLNTSTFDELIPSLYKKYPNMLMAIDLAATAYPTLAISAKPAGLIGSFSFLANISVITATNKSIPALSLLTNATISGMAAVKGKNLTANLVLESFNLTLSWSSIGLTPADVAKMTPQVAALMQLGAIPYVNNILNQGVPIPGFVQGFTLVNPRIAYYDGYIGVSAAFNITSLIN